MNKEEKNRSAIGVRINPAKKVSIGVLPVLSKKIGVKRHNGYYCALYALAVLFAICWILGFIGLCEEL